MSASKDTPVPIPKPLHEVLGIGNPFLDYIVHVNEDYVASLAGQKGGMQSVDHQEFHQILENSGEKPRLIAGGSAANTVKGLAYLGHRCALTGKGGRDPVAAIFKESLLSFGVDAYLTLSDLPTGQAVCLVTPDGQRTLRDYLGASRELCPRDLDPSLFLGVSHVHIEGYTLMNQGVSFRAMELAKQNGATVSFDLSSFELAAQYKEHIIDVLLPHVDILFANEEETYSLTHLDPEQGCLLLKDQCGVAVVKMGSEGCWVGRKEGDLVHRYPAYPVKPLDTTGAGDLFSAGFIHGYLTGRTLQESAKYGALIAAEVVQVYGAEISLEVWNRLRQELNK